jgi:hypothetical protein
MENFNSSSHFYSNLYQVSSIAELPLDRIHDSLARYKFACIRGILSPAVISQAKEQFYAAFNAQLDRGTVGESPKEVQSNFQKFSIGCARGSHHKGSYGRLLRVFFNPLWAEDIYGMHQTYKHLIQVRNKLMGKHDTFTIGGIEDGVWSASRIHQYPRGGGFIQEHRDRTQAGVSEGVNVGYYQVFAIVSQKGIDFEKGGGFIDYGDNRFIIDDFAVPGDIVIYDGSTLHGVLDIDPHKPLDVATARGRLSAFVSLYKDMS